MTEERDPLDVAASTTEKWNQRCIDAARIAPVSVLGGSKASADACINCGELIPSERQIAVPGCQLCVACASVFEQLGSLWRR